MSKKAIIIFSGGVDSTTCIAIAQSQGYECIALSFNYSQRHVIEIEVAKKVAAHFGVEHRIFTLPSGQFGGSALTDKNIAVPQYNGSNAIPATYVPARNTMFLSIALGLAEVSQAQNIFLGINAIDYSHYPDCRPEYLEAFQNLANLATKAGVDGEKFTIHAPLLHLTKAEIIKLGTKLGVDYGMTFSCYEPDENARACGRCDSCTFRKKGFDEAGVEDPTVYY